MCKHKKAPSLHGVEEILAELGVLWTSAQSAAFEHIYFSLPVEEVQRSSCALCELIYNLGFC